MRPHGSSFSTIYQEEYFMQSKDLLKRVKEDNVKFISYQFTDVTGAVKSVDAPINQLEGALEDGVWFDGSSVEGFARIQESDMHLRIDPDTYAVLPWSPADLRRARVFCDIYTPEGKPFEGTRLDIQCRPRTGIFPIQAQRRRVGAPCPARCGRVLRLFRR
jgi:hypothetical protein